MTNTPAVALIRAEANSKHGPTFGSGQCLQRVRECYGVPAKYGSATVAWEHTSHRHSAAALIDVPAGVPVWWTGGSHGYGHVAISAGNGACWSTDIKRPGRFDLVRIADIHRQWGLTLAGWSEDINDVRVYTPPPAKPSKVSRPTPNLDVGIAATQKAIAVRKPGAIRRGLRAALAALVAARNAARK